MCGFATNKTFLETKSKLYQNTIFNNHMNKKIISFAIVLVIMLINNILLASDKIDIDFYIDGNDLKILVQNINNPEYFTRINYLHKDKEIQILIYFHKISKPINKDMKYYNLNNINLSFNEKENKSLLSIKLEKKP